MTYGASNGAGQAELGKTANSMPAPAYSSSSSSSSSSNCKRFRWLGHRSSEAPRLLSILAAMVVTGNLLFGGITLAGGAVDWTTGFNMHNSTMADVRGNLHEACLEGRGCRSWSDICQTVYPAYLQGHVDTVCEKIPKIKHTVMAAVALIALTALMSWIAVCCGSGRRGLGGVFRWRSRAGLAALHVLLLLLAIACGINALINAHQAINAGGKIVPDPNVVANMTMLVYSTGFAFLLVTVSVLGSSVAAEIILAIVLVKAPSTPAGEEEAGRPLLLPPPTYEGSRTDEKLLSVQEA